MSRRRAHPDFFTSTHQFGLADEALSEAANHLRAGWYASSIVHSWQVAHRSAAALLFARKAKVFTEKEVRYGFSAQFVVPGLTEETTLESYDWLDKTRIPAERGYDYTATLEEAQSALEKARAFHAEARRLHESTLKAD